MGFKKFIQKLFRKNKKTKNEQGGKKKKKNVKFYIEEGLNEELGAFLVRVADEKSASGMTERIRKLMEYVEKTEEKKCEKVSEISIRTDVPVIEEVRPEDTSDEKKIFVCDVCRAMIQNKQEETSKEVGASEKKTQEEVPVAREVQAVSEEVKPGEREETLVEAEAGELGSVSSEGGLQEEVQAAAVEEGRPDDPGERKEAQCEKSPACAVEKVQEEIPITEELQGTNTEAVETKGILVKCGPGELGSVPSEGGTLS
ncbi:MAG: uncharacterized protein A8A55_2742 [Amphiamblys sp. WSBS2006]|nr:MAG: uncharacterized protein A8A55_2742 [Amphiamblys sp. WSBS2006]